MKCLISTKTGDIIRVTDQQAHNTVGREWSYTSKAEWKRLHPVNAPKVEEAQSPKREVKVDTETISEKQLKRKKQK